MLGKLDQVAQVELKAAGELKEKLMDAVKPLKRERKGFSIRGWANFHGLCSYTQPGL